MIRERGEEFLLIALVISVAVHIATMVLVKTQVMTHVTTARHAQKTVPMRVTETKAIPDAATIAEIMDLDAVKDEPAVKSAETISRLPSPDVISEKPEAPKIELPELPTVENPSAAVFEGKAFEGDRQALPAVSMDGLISAPLSDVSVAVGPADVPVAAAAPAPVLAPTAEVPAPPPTNDKAEKLIKAEKIPEFKPKETVYEEVNEKAVAAEKQAVRELVNADNAQELEKFVNVTMSSASVNGSTYFKVMVVPRTTLRPVPKDVVLLIDASGSIGRDRMASIRGATKKILRDITNTGDRFNLVAFRDRFTYAFRQWQECSVASFANAERWLNNVAPHGRTDVFSTISSVLTLPRDPKRPLIALVVTDGDANTGVSDNAAILSQFTKLNDGLVSVYMYGVKSSANRELIDVLTHGNRGESLIFDGWRWNAGDDMAKIAERFREPVLSDLRVIFAADCPAEAYPRVLRNLYRGDTLEFVGRVPETVKDVAFSVRGLNGDKAYEGFFRLPVAAAAKDDKNVSAFSREVAIDAKLR